VVRALEELRLNLGQNTSRVRLLLDEDGTPRVESAPLSLLAPARPLRIGLAHEPVSSKDVFLFHKTTNRRVYEARLGDRPDCEDVILFNERGELTEATRANLVLDIEGELVTPPVECGLLAGTFRQEMLDSGVIGERILYPTDLARARRILLINSVRGWMDAATAMGK
jgi:para-aminobenzoate synthetase / 4-amino-4-deoxychorismate lyase